jgi:hypothetical protein
VTAFTLLGDNDLEPQGSPGKSLDHQWSLGDEETEKLRKLIQFMEKEAWPPTLEILQQIDPASAIKKLKPLRTRRYTKKTLRLGPSVMLQTALPV